MNTTKRDQTDVPRVVPRTGLTQYCYPQIRPGHIDKTDVPPCQKMSARCPPCPLRSWGRPHCSRPWGQCPAPLGTISRRSTTQGAEDVTANNQLGQCAGQPFRACGTQPSLERLFRAATRVASRHRTHPDQHESGVSREAGRLGKAKLALAAQRKVAAAWCHGDLQRGHFLVQRHRPGKGGTPLLVKSDHCACQVGSPLWAPTRAPQYLKHSEAGAESWLPPLPCGAGRVVSTALEN